MAASPFQVLFFDGEESGRALDISSLSQLPQLHDQQLLWIDIVGSCAPQELQCTGVDLGRLDPSQAGPLGLAMVEEWKYLYVWALNWQQDQSARAVPIVLAVGPNIVITFHPEKVEFLQSVFDNEADYLRVGHLEATSFATGLLDRMLTDYLDARDDFEGKVDRMELLILKKPKSSQLRDLQQMRRLASRLRHYLSSQRDLFDALGRPDMEPSRSKDVEKHCLAVSHRYSDVMDAIEAARELVNGSFDLYTSRTAESTNQAMHTLTVVTVIMGLAATIAGVMGMNFKSHLFDAGEIGFWIAAGVIGGMVLGGASWAVWRHRPSRNI